MVASQALSPASTFALNGAASRRILQRLVGGYISQAARYILMENARLEGLKKDPLFYGPLLNSSEITARKPDVESFVFLKCT